MAIVTATEFNQRPSEVKARSEREPVFVTDRGRATTVVLSIAEFERLRAAKPVRSLGQALVADDDIDLDIVRENSSGRAADLDD
ncbi:MAG: type II toxin-antitoxin system Phd/YefM family antitoxin [Nevskiaceae bacterium]|jgi:prevent-host-death family protein|nr:type II toxin-antitoxin system Phd/YefM family antitoxin [Nevskiaceae bacterium]